MKNKKSWRILLIIGFVPFIFPFLSFLYEMSISASWTLVDWLVCYSFVYWPTYVGGLIMVFVSAYKLKRIAKTDDATVS